MNYIKPTIQLASGGDVAEPNACIPGFAIAFAIAAVVWNTAGVWNYFGVAAAYAIAGVAFLVVGTKCW